MRANIFLSMLLLLAASVHAATFNCAIRTSCTGGETLFLSMNSSEAGAAPNNSHAYLANYSPTSAYSICCSTDAFRTLANTCVAGSTRVLALSDTNNSHVQTGTNTSYPWSACLNVTYGNVSCAYPNSACSAGYTAMASIASSDFADNTSNAHIGDVNDYLRKVCCQIGGQNPPVIAYVNISPNMTATTRTDLECQNGTVTDADGDNVTLHYNWYRNGTSVTLLNLPMDYDSNTNLTHDISGFGNHGTVNNLYFTPIANGGVGGSFSYTAGNIQLPTIQLAEDTPWAIAYWTSLNAGGRGSLYAVMGENDSAVNNTIAQGAPLSQIMRIYADDGTYAETPMSYSLSSWHHIVISNAGNDSGNIYFYMDGSLLSVQSLATTAFKVNSIGNAGTDSINPWQGALDEVIIFNRSLTPSEVATLYRSNNRQFNSTELRRTEWWNCSITPVDSTGLNGTTKYSNRTNVTGSPPLNATLYYPVNNNQSAFERFMNFSWTAADERDGDAVTYTFNLTITPGTCSVATVQSSLSATNYTFGELCTDQLYNWTINSCDVDGCSGPSPVSNFTVASVVGVQLTVNLTQLGTLDRGQSKATDADNIAPFIVNNTGNVRINITLNATNNPFSSVTIPNANYSFKAGVNTTNAFNTTGSQTTYTAFDTVYKHLIKQLNYTARPDTNTTARIDVNITAPFNEPPGNKQGNFTVQAVAS